MYLASYARFVFLGTFQRIEILPALVLLLLSLTLSPRRVPLPSKSSLRRLLYGYELREKLSATCDQNVDKKSLWRAPARSRSEAPKHRQFCQSRLKRDRAGNDWFVLISISTYDFEFQLRLFLNV